MYQEHKLRKPSVAPSVLMELTVEVLRDGTKTTTIMVGTIIILYGGLVCKYSLN